MTLSSLGVGSGLDVSTIVSQLVAVERSTRDSLLAERTATTNAEVSAFGQIRSVFDSLNSAIGNLGDIDTLTPTTATSGDEETLLVSASSGAQIGSYNAVAVQLASAHKLHTQAYTDSDSEVGYGTLTIELGSESFDVEIAQEDATLAEIRDAINDAEDNPGVRASLLVADDGVRLVLESESTGADNAIRITTAPEVGGEGLADLTYDVGVTENLTELSEAKDGILSVDGFQRSSSTNVISDAVEGLTFTLVAEAPMVEISIDGWP